MAMVTAGLKWAPQQVPKAKFMHHRDAAMENPGALEPPITFKPTVKTRTCVPRNSLSHQSLPIIILAILIQRGLKSIRPSQLPTGAKRGRETPRTAV